MKLYVEGKLKTRTWEKDGQIRRKTEVIAENVQILYRPEQYRNNAQRDEAQNANDEASEQAANEAQMPEMQEPKRGGIFSDIF